MNDPSPPELPALVLAKVGEDDEDAQPLGGGEAGQPLDGPGDIALNDIAAQLRRVIGASLRDGVQSRAVGKREAGRFVHCESFRVSRRGVSSRIGSISHHAGGSTA